YADAGSRELGYNEFQAKLFPALESELSAKKQKVPHPFVAWLGYKRARRRPRAFWRRALIRCAEVDFELKNGADPRLSMERLLLEVCEIGRASCRERVEIWVVAGSVKKEKRVSSATECDLDHIRHATSQCAGGWRAGVRIRWM